MMASPKRLLGSLAVCAGAYHALVNGLVCFAFRRLDEGDYAAVLPLCSEGVRHEVPGGHALGGARSGKGALARWFERLFTLFPGLDLEAGEILVKGWPWNTVVAVFWTAAAPGGSGTARPREGAGLLRMRWGRVVEVRVRPEGEALGEALERMARRGVGEASAPPIRG